MAFHLSCGTMCFAMYIKRLEIQNLRCFKNAAMTFRYPGDGVDVPDGVPNLENVNLILGINGAGKTTALKAVALALLAQLPNTGFRPISLVRHGETRATVEAELALNHGREGDLKKLNTLKAQVDLIGRTEELKTGNAKRFKVFYDDEDESFFMAAYGATRRSETGDFESSYRRKLRSGRYERVAGLFEDHLALNPILKFFNFKSTTEWASLFLRLLPEGLRLNSNDESNLYFDQEDIKVSFAALPDGYRAYVSWLVDLLSQIEGALISQLKPKGDFLYGLMDFTVFDRELSKLKGIVMVDEIDLHVHPTWQKTIIEQVAKAFPNLQFIFTTHSPIVAGSVGRQNLWVTRTLPDGSSTLEQPNSEIYGLNADQILTSDIFGLQSTRAEGFLREMNALEQKAIRGDDEAALALMRGMARGKGAAPIQMPKTSTKRKKT
jgi:AAA domain, putative AbiEii toxin, Type IV TA system